MSRLDDYGEILTVRQVAEVLGIARNSVYQAAAAGQLPSLRVGRRILFAKRSLEVWLSTASTISSPPRDSIASAPGLPHVPIRSTGDEPHSTGLRRPHQTLAARRRLRDRF